MQINDLSLSKSRILIVDNDPVMRLLMKESLSADEYIIEEAEGGRQALALISRQAPDVVLLDVRMPEMSGYDVCAEIRKNHDDSGVAIIMVTGLDAPSPLPKPSVLAPPILLTSPSTGVCSLTAYNMYSRQERLLTR